VHHSLHTFYNGLTHGMNYIHGSNIDRFRYIDNIVLGFKYFYNIYSIISTDIRVGIANMVGIVDNDEQC